MYLKRFKASAILLALLLILAACGGSDDKGVFGGSDDPDTPTEPSQTVGSIQLLTSTPRIGSFAKDATILAVVKDANNTLMSDVPVAFSVDNNGALEIVRQTTNGSGTAEATLSSPGSYKNRVLTASATAGSLSGSVAVEYTGTTLTITGPASVPLGDKPQYTIALRDPENRAISDELIEITGPSSFSAPMITTNFEGNVIITLNADAGGVTTINASALEGSLNTSYEVEVSTDRFSLTDPVAEIDLGTTAPVTLEWEQNGVPIADGKTVRFSTTRGTLSSATAVTSGGTATVNLTATDAGPAVITAEDASAGGTLSTQRIVEFIATTPDAIVTKTDKAQIGVGEQAEITAVVRDASGNLVKNQRITFSLDDVTGGGLTTASSTTDSQGTARTVYQAGSTPSANNGVEITASVDSNPSINSAVTLTVGQRALRISLGTGNEIEEPTASSYRQPWVVYVTDANGAPVRGVEVQLSLLPTGYRKGRWIQAFTAEGDDIWEVLYSTAQPCSAEDVNGNGILDAGEDFNGNGSLEPTNPGSVAADVTPAVTATDGSLPFGINYPQSFCAWVNVELQAKAQVNGSETVTSTNLTLACAAADLINHDITPPGGVPSLYGTAADCSDPN